jgi:hypothetical protein
VALTPGQLNYWKARTKRPNLTMGQAVYQRAQAKLNPAAKPAGPSPATKTWAPPDPTADPNYTLDAGYFAQVAKQRFEAQQKRVQLDEEGTSALSGYNESLRRMQEQTPRQMETATNQANKAGLLYSGTLGRNLGDIQTTALRAQGDLRGSYDQGERARAAARTALEQGATVDEAAAAAEAIDRQMTRDQTAAQERGLVPESTIPPDTLDAGVDVGTPSPKKGGRANTQSTPKYLPRGYAQKTLAQRRAYWQQRRKARRR